MKLFVDGLTDNHSLYRVSTALRGYQEAQLLQRNRTARRCMLVSSFYVSWGMAVRKVSINKSDLQGHSRALAI